MAPWAAGSDHLRLTVRLTPKASTDRIDGIKALSDGTIVLVARVRAAPESGRANAAVEKLLAKALGVPRSAVSLSSGQRSRIKHLRIAGDPEALMDSANRLWPSDANRDQSEA